MPTSLSNFVGSCVQWVETVLPWVPAGPQYAYQYGAGTKTQPGENTLVQAGATPISASALAKSAYGGIGDVVVFNPNQANASASAGHIAVVTGVAQNGDVTISQANWAAPNKPSIMTIPASVAQGLSFFAPPAQDVASSAARAQASTQGLTSNGVLLASTGGGLTATAPAVSQPYQSLGTELGNALPVIGAPGALLQWMAQRQVWSTVVFVGIGLGMIVFGLHLLVRESGEGVGDTAGRLVSSATSVVK